MQRDDEPLRRRPDGGIDTEFYIRRARELRNAAIREALRRWLKAAWRFLAKRQ